MVYNRTYGSKKLLTDLTSWTGNIYKEIYCKCFFEKFCIHHICVFSFLETLKTFSIHFVCKTLSVFSRSLKFMQKLNLKCKNFSTYNKLLVHQLHPNSLVLHRKVCFFRYILERFLVRLWTIKFVVGTSDCGAIFLICSIGTIFITITAPSSRYA